MSVNIHGKEYITVAERVQDAHKEGLLSVTTEVLQHIPLVVIKAIVVTKKGTYTGISAANPSKAIEKQSPYEVAETSAVGRALGFAGYGIVEGIASADEVKKATASEETNSEECQHLKTSNHQVTKEGSNKGRWFKVCENCKKDGKKTFVGWIESPEEFGEPH